jgi:hypothetical protein
MEGTLGVLVFSKSWCHNTSVGCVLYTGIFHMHECMQINTDSKHRAVGTSPSIT